MEIRTDRILPDDDRSAHEATRTSRSFFDEGGVPFFTAELIRDIFAEELDVCCGRAEEPNDAKSSGTLRRARGIVKK